MKNAGHLKGSGSSLKKQYRAQGQGKKMSKNSNANSGVDEPHTGAKKKGSKSKPGSHNRKKSAGGGGSSGGRSYNSNSYYDSSDEDQIRESLNARPNLMKSMVVKRSDIPPTPDEETIYRDNYG